jgi:hypothetical protein
MALIEKWDIFALVTLLDLFEFNVQHIITYICPWYILNLNVNIISVMLCNYRMDPFYLDNSVKMDDIHGPRNDSDGPDQNIQWDIQ